MTIWSDNLIRERFAPEEYAKLNPASVDLSLSCYIKEACWYWQTPLFFRKLVYRVLNYPNPWNRKQEHLFWGKPIEIGGEKELDKWYWLWSNKLVLLSAEEESSIPEDSAGLLVTTSTAGRVGLNHSHSGFADPGFVGHLTFEYVNLALWPIPLYAGRRTIQLVLFKLTDLPQYTYNATGRYQNQSIVPQTVKQEKENVYLPYLGL